MILPEGDPPDNMAMRLNPPDLSKCRTYERYRQELKAWQEVTDIPKTKQGIAIALSLPQDSGESGIREKVFDEIELKDLKKENGLEILINFLDKTLGKDDLSDSLEKFEDFEDYCHGQNETILDYISRFDQKYNRLKKLGMELPSAIVAFKLLRRANITRDERLLVLTGMDYTERDKLYEQAKTSLKKFKGEQTNVAGSSSGTNNSSGSNVAVKLEPAFSVTDHVGDNEEAYLASGYRQRGYGSGWRGNSGRGGAFGGNRVWRGNSWRGGSGAGNGRGGTSFGPGHLRNRGGFGRGRGGGRPMNPVGPDGSVLLCVACGSFRHLVANCPDSWENMGVNQVSVVEEETEKAVLFTGFPNLSEMGCEGRNCAVLDSACSSTVCGDKWLECYLESLDEQDSAEVKSEPGTKWFKFGGGERLKSQRAYTIPAVLAGKKVLIKTDVVNSDIPLLLSMDAMKKAEVKLDMSNDMAEIFGVQLPLNHTSSGHYAIPIDKVREIPVESVCAVRLGEVSHEERYKALRKLHRQFTHPPQKKLVALMKDAGAWKDEFLDDLDDIYAKCELCKVYKKTPSRPVVALPMASRFNEKVCMDLKKWGDQWILHMIDMFSRFSVSVFLSRKRPSDVIDKVMTCWVGAGFGVMETLFTDNGGEFSSDEMREVASILNIKVCTTAAESPFQNGLCERNHAVIDMMLIKLQDQCPGTNLQVLLAWANMAKNCLQMWHGFSSYQLVFGQNPNLPNIMTDQVPALGGTTTSEVLSKHLNALHAARQAFVQSESDERIRRALRSKIRSSEQMFDHGESVYYKREGQNRWLGPAKVVFQDGKVVFVRHGGVFVRVSPNRLLKAGLACVTSGAVCDPLRGEKFGSMVSQRLEVPAVDGFEEGDAVPVLEPDEREPVSEVIDDVGVDSLNAGDASSTGQNAQGLELGQHTTVLSFKKNDRVRYKLHPESEWVRATVIGRAGKATGQYRYWFNVKEDESGIESCVDFENMATWEMNEAAVNLVLIPRSKHGESECMQAKQVELKKLKDFDTYQEVDDTGQYRISTTWVLWWKGDEVRARLVARGYEETGSFRTDSPTVCKSTVRILLSVAASKRWNVKTTDIKSAFLQGRKLERRVFLKPPKEAGVPDGKIWELKHCLYGLNDAAREFYFSVEAAMREMGCQQSSLDPALFYFITDGQLRGVMVSHIDDFLHAGDFVFEEEVMNKLRSRFLAGKLEVGQFTYVGFQVTQTVNGIVMDQSEYMTGLDDVALSPKRACQMQEPLMPAEQTVLRELVGRINWAVQGSRPDMAFEMVELSTKSQGGTVADLNRAMKAIRKLKGGDGKVVFPNLGDPVQWKMVVFSDAAHANICNGLGSVGAHAVFLCNCEGRCCPLSWQANKIKRVVRSSLAAEALSLQEGLEDAIYMKHLLCELLSLPATCLPIFSFVDSKGLVEAVHSTRLVDDKRLRINVGAIKDSLAKHEIETVYWLPGTAQIVNCMTKRGAAGFQLLSALQSGQLELPSGTLNG